MPNPRTPTALKLMRGTAQPSRMNKAEPKPAKMPLSARPPTWLQLSPVAHSAWRHIARILRGMGVATTADPLAIAMLCEALAEYVQARKYVRENGPTVESVTMHGESTTVVIKPNPAAAQASDAWRRARLLLNDYGLTAASRGKVSAHDEVAKSGLAKWIEGGG